MANKNQKNEKQPEQKPSDQPTTPVKPVDLSDEELGQVVGGNDGGITAGHGIQPDPTAVE